MRHADLLHDGAYRPVGQVIAPRGVGRDVGGRAALREAEVDRVDDGDGQRHGDEVERDGEQHHGRRRRTGRTRLRAVTAAADRTARARHQLVLDDGPVQLSSVQKFHVRTLRRARLIT